MKRFVLTVVMLLTFTKIGSAVPISCLSISNLQQLLAMAPEGCIAGDKIFRDFSYSSADAGLVAATPHLTASSNGWTFARAGTWTTAFTLSYIIEVAPGFPSTFILAVKDQQNSGLTPNASTVTDTEVVLSGGGQTLILTTSGASTGLETQQAPFNPLARSIRTTSVFNPGGAELNSWEQTWFQTTLTVPEPPSLMFCALGTVLAGCLRRYKKSSRIQRS